MRFSRTKLIAVLFGVLGLIAAACGSSDDSSSGSSGDGPDKIKLTLQWVTQAQFAGYHAALDQGYYADENLDVTIQPGGPDINPIQLLISGDSDIVIQPFGVVLTSREAGADVVSMGQVFERGAYRLVYFDDQDISGVPDWAGKTIGLWGGFDPDVSAAFGKYGMNVDEDANIFSQGWDMVAFLDGQLDLASAMTYNEYAQALAGNESDREILMWDPNEEGTATLEDSLVTTEAWLAANPDIAERFIRATARGWIHCRDNPESCIDIVLASGTALPRDFQTWQMNEVNKLLWPSTNGLFNLTDDMYQQSADVLYNYGVIENPASKDSFDMSHRDRALRSEKMPEGDLFGNNFKPMDLDPRELFG